MNVTSSLLVILSAIGSCGEDSCGEEAAKPNAEPIQILTTKDGVRFGLWPQRPDRPAPTLVVLASSIEETLSSPYFRQSGHILARQGYLCVSVDLPCHGQETRPQESPGLSGWRVRTDRDEDFVADATDRMRKVMDYLIAERLADPERIGVLGTSRGGFMALHFAASDPRVKCVAAFAPVTDLGALSEFRGAEHQPLVRRLAIEKQADALANRAIWLVIGDRDARVGTDLAIQFARLVTAASLAKQLSPRVDLHVLASPQGHTTPAGSAEQAAIWIDKQMGGN